MTDGQPRLGGPEDDTTLRRIADRLRMDDPRDPQYRPGRFARLVDAGVLVDRGPTGQPLVRGRMRSPLLSGLGVGSFGLAVALIAGLIVARQDDRNQVGATPSPLVSDLLAEVRTTGVLRVAIRPDFPQATTDKLAGFDVDVAGAVATRLKVRLQIAIADASAMGSTSRPGSWDVAMPSSARLAASPAFVPSDPYYAFPTLLVVLDGSSAQSPDDLHAPRVCVVEGSAGQNWVEGHQSEAAVPPPAGAVARVEPNDQACLDALTAHEVDAVATTTLSSADLGVRPSVRVLGQPVLVDGRPFVARRDGADPSALLASINAALADMRLDGTLTGLSRSRFGGQDLSVP